MSMSSVESPDHRHVSQEEIDTPLTSFASARAQVAAMAEPLETTEVEIEDAVGCVTAQNIVSGIDVPPFDNSAMDGYVVIAADVQVGVPQHGSTMVKINTGRPLPEGFDSVVPWEHTTSEDQAVTITQPVTAGQFVRRAGNDIEKGDIAVPAQTELNPVAIGVLASIGHETVVVRRWPVANLLITGSEVQSPKDPLADGKIFDANSYLITAFLNNLGVEVGRIDYVDDDHDATVKALNEESECDFVIATGGASVGEVDFVRKAVEEVGSIDLWRVAVRPGKPFAAGSIGDIPILLLPGNPGSVLSCLQAFVAPFVRGLKGASAPQNVSGVLNAAIPNGGERTFMCPVRVAGDVTPLIGESSQGLRHAISANGFVIVEPGGTPAGTTVSVELLP